MALSPWAKMTSLATLATLLLLLLLQQQPMGVLAQTDQVVVQLSCCEELNLLQVRMSRGLWAVRACVRVCVRACVRALREKMRLNADCWKRRRRR